MDGKHADISQVTSISNTLSEVCNYYIDLYAIAEDRSELAPLLHNLLLVLYAVSVEDSSIPYYYSTFLTVFSLCFAQSQPVFDSFYPFLIASISQLHSLTALQTVANVVLLSDAIGDALMAGGLLDALHDFLRAVPSAPSAFPGAAEYSYWLLVFILGNLAAGGEAAVDRILNHSLRDAVNRVVVDPRQSRGIRKEYVYFMSYLVESASETQVGSAQTVRCRR